MATATATNKEFRAEARFQRVSPQKARLVLDLIRGLRVDKALETVAFTRKRVAPIVAKVLRSAIDNANYLAQERGEDLDVDNLVVVTAVANEGPRMKRIRPAPQGRAFRYQRRMSHIIVSVAERGEGTDVVTSVDAKVSKKAAKKSAAKTSAKKSAAKKAPAKKTAAKKSAKK